MALLTEWFANKYPKTNGAQHQQSRAQQEDISKFARGIQNNPGYNRCHCGTQKTAKVLNSAKGSDLVFWRDIGCQCPERPLWHLGTEIPQR